MNHPAQPSPVCHGLPSACPNSNSPLIYPFYDSYLPQQQLLQQTQSIKGTFSDKHDPLSDKDSQFWEHWTCSEILDTQLSVDLLQDKDQQGINMDKLQWPLQRYQNDAFQALTIQEHLIFSVSSILICIFLFIDTISLYIYIYIHMQYI